MSQDPQIVPTGLANVWRVEATARELEKAGVAPSQAYAYGANVWRLTAPQFDGCAARDELRRAGYAPQAANAMMNTFREVRRALGLDHWEPL